MSIAEDLREELNALREVREQYAAELQRIKQEPAKAPEKRVSPLTTRRRVSSDLGWHNPSTGQPYDEGMVMEMWRRDLVRGCACGEVKYAQTQAFVGEHAITVASRPGIDQKTGQIYQMAWEPAYSEDGECVVPESLRLDDEKRAHIKECNEAHEQVPEEFANELELQRAAVKMRKATA